MFALESFVGVKCVRTSRMDSFLNLSPLYTHVYSKVIAVFEISAVILWWDVSYLLALQTSSIEKRSIYLFQVSGLKWLWLMISVSIAAMKR